MPAFLFAARCLLVLAVVVHGNVSGRDGFDIGGVLYQSEGRCDLKGETFMRTQLNAREYLLQASEDPEKHKLPNTKVLKHILCSVAARLHSDLILSRSRLEVLIRDCLIHAEAHQHTSIRNNSMLLLCIETLAICVLTEVLVSTGLSIASSRRERADA